MEGSHAGDESELDRRIIDEAYENDPEAARAEYGGEFRNDLADFVTRETVDAVTMWGRQSCRPSLASFTAVSATLAAASADSMTLAVGHLRRDAVPILDCGCLRSERRSILRKRSRSAPPCPSLWGRRRSLAISTRASGRRPASPSMGSSSSRAHGRRATFTAIFCPAQRPPGRIARPAALEFAALRAGKTDGAQRTD